MKKRTGNTGKANRRTKRKKKKEGAKLQGERARLLFEASGELFLRGLGLLPSVRARGSRLIMYK